MSAATNPLLEINPAACLFVVGPQLTATAHHDETCAQALSYRSIVEAGISTLQSSKAIYSNKEEKMRHIRAIKEEAKNNLILAMQKIIHTLKQHGCYEEWLKTTFGTNEQHEEDTILNVESSSAPETIAHLLSLQSQGAMLACTQYDTLLDSMADTKPFTLHEIKEWATATGRGDQGTLKDNQVNSSSLKWLENVHDHNAGSGGFLHLNGVYTAPDSVHLTNRKLDAVICKQLREVFQRKLVIFLGFDGEYMDPLLPVFLDSLFLESEPGSLRNPPILLTSRPSMSTNAIAAGSRRPQVMSASLSSRHDGFNIPSQFLQLRIHDKEIHRLTRVISAGSTKNFTVGRGHTEKQSDGMKVQAFLLFNEKQSFRKLGDVIYQQSKSGEIYVRRDALTVIFDNNQILYGNLVTYGGNGLRQLWDLVFSEESTLLGKGLVGFGLQNAAIIWTRRKPAGLGNVTGINSVHTYAAHKALHTLTLAQQCGMSDSKSPILIPVSTPPSNTDTHQSSASPVDTPTTRPSQLKISSSPPKLQGGQTKIRTPVISPPIATRATPLTGGLFPSIRTPTVRMSPMTGAAALPFAVNPIHNPFMTGLTRFTTPGMFPGSPVLVSAKNPLLSTGSLQSRSSTSTIASAQTQTIKANSDLSTHMQMVLQLQNARLNAQLSSRAQQHTAAAGVNLPQASHDTLVLERAGYILKYNSSPPIYCIAPPEELMPSSHLNRNDPSHYEHTIEYIDTLSPSYTTWGENEKKKRTSHSRRSIETIHGPSTSAGEPSDSQISANSRRNQQTLFRLENDKHTLQSMVSGHKDKELHQTGLRSSLTSHHQLRRNDEDKTSHSKHFNRHQVKSSVVRQRMSPPPLLHVTQDAADKDKPNRSALSLRVAAPPLSSQKQTSTPTSNSTLPKTVITPAAAYLPSVGTAVTTPTGLFKTLSNNMSTSFSPTKVAATVMTPNLVSLPPGVGYCVMMNPLSGFTMPAQPTMVLPTGTSPGATLQPQLPMLIPAQPTAVAVNPPTAVVAAGDTSRLSSPQIMYYIMPDSGSSKTQETTDTAKTPTYMVIQQEQRQSSSIRHSTTPPSLNTGSTTRHLTLHKRTIASPEDHLPKPKHKKLVKQDSESRLIAHYNHTDIDRDIDHDRLHSECESHDRSHVIQHQSHDVQRMSHDTRYTSNSSTELDSNEDIHHRVNSYSTNGIGRRQYVSEEETMATESEEEMITEGEERTSNTDHTRHHHQQQQLSSTTSGKSHIQLWEFLLQLLLTPDHGTIIQWTGNNYEFSIINPDAVARLWGSCKNKPRMTYEKLSRALRYYYSRGILDKVTSKRLTFRFSFDVHKYIVERNKASLENQIT